MNRQDLTKLGEHCCFLKVKIEIESDSEDDEKRFIGVPIHGDIILQIYPDERSDETIDINVGWIAAWKTKSRSRREIDAWADSECQDLYDAFIWLISEQKYFNAQTALKHSVLFLDRVFIEPEWRGSNFSLLATATYLDLLNPGFVFLKPATPKRESVSIEKLEKTDALLRRHWQKLGLRNFDAEHNFLWSKRWDCPQYLREVKPRF